MSEQQLKQQIDRLNEENERLSAELYEAEDRISKLESDISDLEDEQDKLQSQLDDIEELKVALRDYFLGFGLVSERDRLHDRIQSLVQEL
jgi:septal ring factor EnvC (AmiA/AmiB activator)